MPTITPFLWFNDNAEEAINFYTAVFKDSKVINVTRLPEGTPGPGGKVTTGTIELAGQKIMVLNGGPLFTFNEAVSFFISCHDQLEIDYYWNMLTEGGAESQCGWLKDKFGLSWQVVPEVLGDLLGGPDPAKAQAALQAMLKMKKLDIATLQKAYDEA